MKHNEFNQDKLTEYNERTKRVMQAQLTRVKETTEHVKDNLERMKGSADDLELLAEANDTHFLLDTLSKVFFDFINIENEVKNETITDKEEWVGRTHSRDLAEIYNILSGKDFKEYEKLIEYYEFYPPIGTQPYCECMGYYDMDRIGYGKHIKKSLKDEYPEIVFSVTTEKEWLWGDTVTVKIHRDDDEKDWWAFRDEVDGFLKQFRPRARVHVSFKY